MENLQISNILKSVKILNSSRGNHFLPIVIRTIGRTDKTVFRLALEIFARRQKKIKWCLMIKLKQKVIVTF